MGIYQSGAFGPFSGRIGSVVGVKWKGLNVVRNYPRKSSKAPAVAQLQHRDKFAFVMRFVSQTLELINIGYGNVSGNLNAENIAFKYHFAHAVKGAHPDYELDYELVKLSNSVKMDEVLRPEVTAKGNLVVGVTWDLDERANRYTSSTDRAFILLFNPLKGFSIKSCGEVRREALEAELFVPASFEGDRVHCWIFFVAEQGKLSSATSYVGEIIC